MSARPKKRADIRRWFAMSEAEQDADSDRFGERHWALMKIGFSLCACHERVLVNEGGHRLWGVNPGSRRRRHRRQR